MIIKLFFTNNQFNWEIITITLQCFLKIFCFEFILKKKKITPLSNKENQRKKKLEIIRKIKRATNNDFEFPFEIRNAEATVKDN